MSYLQSFLHTTGKLLPAVLFTATLALAQEGESSLAKAIDDQDIAWGPCPAFIGEGCQMAVLHGDPAKPNTDVFFKVPGNFEIPNHWHTSPERMALLSGKMRLTYENEKSNMLLLGHYAYGPAKKPHKAYCYEGDACVLFIAFEDPVDAFEVK